MSWVMVGGAALGAAGSYLGRDSNPTTSQTQQGSAAGTSGGTQSFTPHQSAYPFYGFGTAAGQNLMMSPEGMFPGASYVGPSALTQLGVGAAAMAGQAGLQGAQNLYQQAGRASPYYQQAAQMGARGVPMFGQAAQMGARGVPLYGQGARSLQGAAGRQADIAERTALNNYNFLSRAADVANNQYVQDQLTANRQQVQEGLLRDVLPQINSSAASVDALGGSRQGLMQGQAVGDAAQALANQNASTMLNAYGQGLSAQQGALAQTGALQQAMMQPGMTLGMAGQMYGQGMDQLSRAAQQYGLAGQQTAQAGGYYGQGMNQLGAAGNWADRGLGSYAQQLQNAQGLANNALGMIGGGGQTVERYQQQALQDAMLRYGWGRDDLMNRLQIAQQMAGFLQPLGQQHSVGYQNTNTSGVGTGANPNYQSAMGSLLTGAMGGLGVAGKGVSQGWWG